MSSRSLLGLSATLLIAAAASGQTNIVYGVSGVSSTASSLYTINIANGASTLVGATGFNGVGGIALSPGGVLYGVAAPVNTEFVVAHPESAKLPRLAVGGRQLITINTTTGAGTLVGGTGVNNGFSDIAFRSDGVLFAITGGGQLYTINPTTGLATTVGANQGNVSGGGLAFNSQNVLYLADDNRLYTVNQATGARTLVQNLNFNAFTNPGSSRLSGMKFHPASGVLYGSVLVEFADPFASVNLSTGVVTNIGNPGLLLEAIAISGTQQAPPPPPSSVPVPSSLLMLGTGLAATGIWIFLRRRALG